MASRFGRWWPRLQRAAVLFRTRGPGSLLAAGAFLCAFGPSDAGVPGEGLRGGSGRLAEGGALFEGAGRSYGTKRVLLLHGALVGGLWASGCLHLGRVHAAHRWPEQMESDVTPLLPEETPVWVRADNAYYSRDFAEFCLGREWDY